MNHTHHYSFWHAHDHSHTDILAGKELVGTHDTGHYHNWMQTHEHGVGGRNPHTHKDRQYHEEKDPETKHHHALDAHDIEEEKQDVPANSNADEHHPECKPPYYGGGLKGCIGRCKANREEEV